MSYIKRVAKLLFYSGGVCLFGLIPISLYFWAVFSWKAQIAYFLNLKVRSFVDIAIIFMAVIVISIAGIMMEDDTESKKKVELSRKEKDLENREAKLTKREKNIQERENEFRLITESETQSYPWIAQQVADYWFTIDSKNATYLRTKSHPAISAAKQVSEIAKEKRALQKQCKMYEYQLNFLREALPWLDDYMTVDPKEAYKIARGQVEGDEENYEKYKNWLSPQEYATLSTAEKYQRALDRYLKQPKNDWEAGIIYERYVGYQYENTGYRVEYFGATRKKEDMGRDLVATKGNTTLIIQCKRYRAEKEVHENTIFQTYGTAVMYQLEHPEQDVHAVVITTAKFSDTALDCANYLKVDCHEDWPLRPYPLIKCNISKTGEKIYHLPFDQQYDNIRLNPEDGDCYVHTVAEAEKLGFRRAYRWQGDRSQK